MGAPFDAPFYVCSLLCFEFCDVVRARSHTIIYIFFKLYAFILLTSTLVPGINYFVVTTHPLHQLQVRKRNTCSNSCYMIETYNTRHRFPCY